MTCREFKHNAASLTLWELTGSQDRKILAHAEACSGCGTWLQKQRSLAASMQTLRATSAGLEAGPSVEQALLRAFRQAPCSEAVRPPVGVKERFGPRPVAALRSTPIAMRLSRAFEIGAYVALAAALIVGVFLGVRLMHDRQVTGPMQSQAVPASAAPATSPSVSAEASARKQTPQESGTLATNHSPARLRHAVARPSPAGTPEATAENSQTVLEAGYVPLMFCDSLSCSADSQIVRMELPSPAGQDTQPQIADVVVGYDGVVRAVRMVN